MTEIDIEEFGKQYKDKSFSEIMAIANNEDKKGSAELFFIEIIKCGKNLEDADKEFLEISEKIIESLLDNSKVIDKDLLLYLGRINNGLKKY
ncbi:hypothetical protein [uncultured Formosa sp.]|uniref:hypothetical protein n=1 Tax=uncultured Formosa sp. TaxID=255435 RepID=UPI0026209F58|nr:hypothetical protein [uncultured Formosa sp.]